MEYFPTTRLGEIESLDLAETLAFLEAYESSFLLDEDLGWPILMRLLRHEGWHGDQAAVAAVTRLLNRLCLLLPLDLRVWDLAARLTGDPAAEERARALDALWTGLPEGILDLSGCLSPGKRLDRKREELLARLPRHRDNILLAWTLTRLDFAEGLPPGEWSRGLRPDPAWEADWRRVRFLHLVGLGRMEQAAELAMRLGGGDEVFLAAAGLALAGAGESDQAFRALEASLALDPRQDPLRRKLAALRAPFSARPQVLERPTAVCLYTYNKAEMLGQTLESLADAARQGGLGRALVRVLVNGCTDASLAVARRAAELFPERDYAVLETPVNVGAPAARNWLLSLPEVAAAERVAFLDDDVLLPPDWLAGLGTALEADPKLGAVGCKVLCEPAQAGGPAPIQFLFRNVAAARKGLLVLTEPRPMGAFDNGLYDYRRGVDTVMGCCHLLRREALDAVPGGGFDLRFSPTQLDDAAHDLDLRLAGWRVGYCGHVAVTHRQDTGAEAHKDPARLGNVLGNDVKFYYRFKRRLGELAGLAATRSA